MASTIKVKRLRNLGAGWMPTLRALREGDVAEVSAKHGKRLLEAGLAEAV